MHGALLSRHLSWDVSFQELYKISDILNVPIPIEVLSQVGSCFSLNEHKLLGTS